MCFFPAELITLGWEQFGENYNPSADVIVQNCTIHATSCENVYFPSKAPDPGLMDPS